MECSNSCKSLCSHVFFSLETFQNIYNLVSLMFFWRKTKCTSSNATFLTEKFTYFCGMNSTFCSRSPHLEWHYSVIFGFIRKMFFFTGFTQIFVTNITVQRWSRSFTEMTPYQILKAAPWSMVLYFVNCRLWIPVFIFPLTFITYSCVCINQIPLTFKRHERAHFWFKNRIYLYITSYCLMTFDY